MIKYKDNEYTQYNPYKRPVKHYAEEFEKIENLKCESGNFIQLIFFAFNPYGIFLCTQS